MKKCTLLLLLVMVLLLASGCSQSNGEDVVIAISDAEKMLLEKMDEIHNTLITEPTEVDVHNEEETTKTKVEVFLGEDNGFDKFREAKSNDEKRSVYEEELLEMVRVVCDGLQATGKLGTEAAQTAIYTLVPEHIISEGTTSNEKMSAVYNYITRGEISRYFTIKYDGQGFVKTISIEYKNIENYIKDCLKTGVFTGDINSFEVNPEVNTLDECSARMNITKELAVVFFDIIEMYTIGWIDGDYTHMLDNYIE